MIQWLNNNLEHLGTGSPFPAQAESTHTRDPSQPLGVSELGNPQAPPSPHKGQLINAN